MVLNFSGLLSTLRLQQPPVRHRRHEAQPPPSVTASRPWPPVSDPNLHHAWPSRGSHRDGTLEPLPRPGGLFARHAPAHSAACGLRHAPRRVDAKCPPGRLQPMPLPDARQPPTSRSSPLGSGLVLLSSAFCGGVLAGCPRSCAPPAVIPPFHEQSRGRTQDSIWRGPRQDLACFVHSKRSSPASQQTAPDRPARLVPSPRGTIPSCRPGVHGAVDFGDVDATRQQVLPERRRRRTRQAKRHHICGVRRRYCWVRRGIDDAKTLGVASASSSSAIPDTQAHPGQASENAQACYDVRSY